MCSVVEFAAVWWQVGFEETPEKGAIEHYDDEVDKRAAHAEGNIRFADWDTADDGHSVEEVEEARHLVERTAVG